MKTKGGSTDMEDKLYTSDDLLKMMQEDEDEKPTKSVNDEILPVYRAVIRTLPLYGLLGDLSLYYTPKAQWALLSADGRLLTTSGESSLPLAPVVEKLDGVTTAMVREAHRITRDIEFYTSGVGMGEIVACGYSQISKLPKPVQDAAEEACWFIFDYEEDEEAELV